MSGRFIGADEIVRETFEWGEVGWISRPSSTGSSGLCVMDVTIFPGGGHPFHRHPEQEEIIWVRTGRIEQWLEQEQRELGPGDSIHIDRDVVHGSYNDTDEPVHLQVILAPAYGEGGYEAVDVSAEEPWASLR